MIFHACFVAVERRVTCLAVVVDVDVGFAVGAWDDDARLLLFCQIQTCDHLENFYKDVDFKGQKFEEFVKAILKFFVEDELSFVEAGVGAFDDAV